MDCFLYDNGPPLSYRKQSIDLQSKSMNWLLYDNGLRHERVKPNSDQCFHFNVPLVFWRFQEVQNGNISQEWFNNWSLKDGA